MLDQRARILAAFGGMAVVIFFSALIAILKDGTISFDPGHILLTLFAGIAAYLGWPKQSSDRQA